MACIETISSEKSIPFYLLLTVSSKSLAPNTSNDTLQYLISCHESWIPSLESTAPQSFISIPPGNVRKPDILTFSEGGGGGGVVQRTS